MAAADSAENRPRVIDLGSVPKTTELESCLEWLHTNCFRELLAIENSVEERKVTLASRPDFTLENAWALFSDSQIQRLSCHDLLEGCARLGITSDSADMKLLVARFDSSEDSRLSFWEFAHIFTPIEPTLADDLPRRGRISRDGMSAETRDRVADLLRVTIDSECMVESIRQ